MLLLISVYEVVKNWYLSFLLSKGKDKRNKMVSPIMEEIQEIVSIHEREFNSRNASFKNFFFFFFFFFCGQFTLLTQLIILN